MEEKQLTHLVVETFLKNDVRKIFSMSQLDVELLATSVIWLIWEST